MPRQAKKAQVLGALTAMVGGLADRIYVPDEDFDFVYDFLRKHCTKA